MNASTQIHFCAGEDFDLQAAVQRVGIEQDVVAMDHFAVEDLDGQRVLDQSLNRPLSWTGAIGPIMAV